MSNMQKISWYLFTLTIAIYNDNNFTILIYTIMIMKKMLKSCSILAVLAVASMAAGYAQPMPTPVVPGEKGVLSSTGAPVAPANTIPGLHIREVWFHPPYYSGGSGYYVYRIYAPEMYPLDINSYELQYLQDGTWTYIAESSTNFYDICFGGSYDFKYGQYRMLVHGGDYDGYVTNSVDVRSNAIGHTNAQLTGYGWSGNQWENPVIGDRLQPINVRVDQLQYNDGTWSSLSYHLFDEPMGDVLPTFDSNVTTAWYRRNPYTNELTPIEPNANNSYTVKAEDFGYEICFMVDGNPSVFDFHFELISKTPVMIPVDCHFSYQNTDGFIINTNYELPTLEDAFKMSYYDDGKKYYTDYTVNQLAPGTYAVKLGEGAPQGFDLQFNKFVYDYAKLSYYYSFMEAYDEDHPNTKHQGIYYDLYPRYFDLKVTMKGQPVDGARVVASRTNLNGELEEHKISLDDTNLFLGEYQLCGIAPGSVLTYYKRTVNPENAELMVVPCKEGEGEWYMQTDKEYVLDLIPEDEAGIIEVSANVAASRKYDLMGRVINGTPRGLYIQNGKKSF